MTDEDGKRDRNLFVKSQTSHIRAKKSFGQNFLVDASVIERIVQAVEPREDETIIEIGSGLGALTGRLAETAGRLVAIELDRDLTPQLRKKFDGCEGFMLVEGDALLLDLCSLIAPAQGARLVANLPYYISTAILQRLLEQRECLTELTLMLQREVAERITAAPGTSERGYLSVLVEAYAEVEKLFDVAPTAFRPSPKVWSTIVRLNVRRRIAVEVPDELLLWRIVSTGFAQRRKTIFNNLRYAQTRFPGYNMDETSVRRLLEVAGIEQQRRAETLTLADWARLSIAFGA